MMDMTNGKAKSDYMRKAAAGRCDLAFSFLDSLDHEVKKQNVCIAVVSIVQLLSSYVWTE